MIKINDNWQFAKGKPDEFVSVDLPHDWLISDVNKMGESNVGWYKKDLDTSFFSESQRMFIRFDGVYMDSTLFVNGTQVGEWKYGYTAFEYEITNYLSNDKVNTLMVKVDYKSGSGRWYTGAGIYRDVFLKVKNACHFVSDGIYITTNKHDNKWYYEVEAEVESAGQAYGVKHTLLEAGDEIIAWDIDNPHLYTMRSELLVDGIVVDTQDTRFGFRTIEYTTDNGFFLNDRHVRIKGVCLHHDLGSLGSAVYPDAIRRQLSILRNMGVNALRTAHNPPAKIFMDIADEMGFLIMSEIFDTWKNPKTTNDYARFFNEWVEKDVASWIRRDRNHPSIIMWSIGNEIHDTHVDAEDGLKTMTYLMELVSKHDPKKHAPVTLCSNYMIWENTQKCADVIKLMGYNYGENLYDDHHSAHPDWIIYGAETCSTVQSRGVYRFPLSKSILSDDDLQCSVLGNSSTSWGAKNVEACLLGERNTTYSLGQFIWVGQDHIGEPTPYHTKNSYLGHIDTAGFPKDTYYIFQSAWTDYKSSPMIHLFPYWDFSPNQIIDVRVCSNAPTVELFFNDKSLGKINLTDRLIADWQIPYSTGTLRAVAYDEQGRIIAEECKSSFGDVDKILLQDEIFGELAFVTITACDQDGNQVENANCRVHISVEDGQLLSLDNGDSTDFEQYQTDNKRLFNGKLLAIVKFENGVTPKIKATLDDKDIPIRKIELTLNDLDVSAKIFPHNATYNDLYWRLTDTGGIDSMFGSLDVDAGNMEAKIIPKGDGTLCVRCSAKNGREHITLISQQITTLNGTGKLFFDPYSYIFAGTYNYCNVEPTNGNERGVATLRDGETHVGFKDIDFGDYGSDELTLSLFPLSHSPFTFDIWEGIPLEGGTKICTADYNKGSIWNTYQDVSYKLPYKLRGVTSLCVVFRQKVHIKGFYFKKYEKALQKLSATECNHISGDSYSLQKDTIENIGNNVTIVFENMDFGSEGVESIELSWRSKLPKNSIQLVFSDEDNKIQKVIDVSRADEYTSDVYSLGEKIQGKKVVMLIFLPGCNIDLAWIKFHVK